MGKIENILHHDERVIKKQGKINYSSKAGMPVGDLYLTNKRLIFMVSRGWSFFSISPSGALTGKDVSIPLEQINKVEKGSLGDLKVQADKLHIFSVTVFKASGWLDAILQATSTQPPQFTQPQTPTSTPTPQVGTNNFCSNCGLSLKPAAKFCSNCGAKV